jgi:hypothetical protein
MPDSRDEGLGTGSIRKGDQSGLQKNPRHTLGLFSLEKRSRSHELIRVFFRLRRCLMEISDSLREELVPTVPIMKNL